MLFVVIDIDMFDICWWSRVYRPVYRRCATGLSRSECAQ